MKNVVSYLAVSLLIVTATACQRESAQSEPVRPDPSSVGAPTRATRAPEASISAPYDLRFLDTMSKHHASAVAMAKMAEGKIEQAGLKELVAKIPGDQQKEIDQMKVWRDQWYPGAPSTEDMQMPGMSSTMSMDMGSMQTMKRGHGYDLMFINMMVPHHESAVMMARDALAKAEHSQIKTLSQQIIDAQTSEIVQMNKWKEALTRGAGAPKR